MSKKLTELNQIIGHTNIVNWFASCIMRDKLPQVIMLYGSAGIGKTSIAKIVACEIAYQHESADRLKEAKKRVIVDGGSTDAVRFYNMSNLHSQDAVQEVKADLNVGLSSTGRKVIIMDEAHRMSDEAQDSLLTSFTNLQQQVYVLICTTDIEMFREAFLSRCLMRHLHNLSESDMRAVLQQCIAENELRFELSLNSVLALCINYCGRDARKAINLLDSFEKGSCVSIADLDSFFNVHQGNQLVKLVDYLYEGNILAGLDFIKDLDLDSTFSSSLLEILKVSQGSQSSLISKDATLHLRNVVEQYGYKNLLGFVIDVTTSNRISRTRLSGLFLKWNVCADEIVLPQKKSVESIKTENIGNMRKMIDDSLPVSRAGNAMAPQMKTLEALIAESETLVE